MNEVMTKDRYILNQWNEVRRLRAELEEARQEAALYRKMLALALAEKPNHRLMYQDPRTVDYDLRLEENMSGTTIIVLDVD